MGGATDYEIDILFFRPESWARWAGRPCDDGGEREGGACNERPPADVAAVTERPLPTDAELHALLDAESVGPGRRPPGARRCLAVQRGRRWMLAHRVAPSVAVLGAAGFWAVILAAMCR